MSPFLTFNLSPALLLLTARVEKEKVMKEVASTVNQITNEDIARLIH